MTLAVLHEHCFVDSGVPFEFLKVSSSGLVGFLFVFVLFSC